MPITPEGGDQKIRIQQDLPKQLREVSQILNRVLKAAAAHPKFKSAKFWDYKIRLNGKDYGPHQLELLPKPIRPSTLATRSSETTLVFFTRHTAFSNHHPSPFTFKGKRYANMEHYLAHQRAILSQDKELMARAMEATDPLEAKAILSYLKQDHADQWNDRVENILPAGLRQKFNQNEALCKILVDTQNLTLGEASKDPRWGIGMSLEDATVLDTTKWLTTGNLLGRILSKVREEVSQQPQRRKTASAVDSMKENTEVKTNRNTSDKGDTTGKGKTAETLTPNRNEENADNNKDIEEPPKGNPPPAVPQTPSRKPATSTPEDNSSHQTATQEEALQDSTSGPKQKK